MSTLTKSLEPAQWRQLFVISLVAVAAYFGLRALPTGTNLNHMDFRVEAKGASTLEFCDPSNPQFIPVVAVRSPVVMSVRSVQPARTGVPVSLVTSLKTASGKPLAPEDLMVMHTRKLHLLLIDPSLTDYQHVHPEPTRTPGEWAFSFTPRAHGTYRVFADFTPVATGRGLYASADLEVAPAGVAPAQTAAGNRTDVRVVERDGYHFTLSAAQDPVRVGAMVDWKFAISKPDGGAVPLEPVMDAYAHLVAFDEARSGFAHLHPMEADLAQRPDALRPELNFKLMIPRAGSFVVWAQIVLGGQEQFVPFAISVVE